MSNKIEKMAYGDETYYLWLEITVNDTSGAYGGWNNFYANFGKEKNEDTGALFVQYMDDNDFNHDQIPHEGKFGVHWPVVFNNCLETHMDKFGDMFSSKTDVAYDISYGDEWEIFFDDFYKSMYKTGKHAGI